MTTRRLLLRTLATASLLLSSTLSWALDAPDATVLDNDYRQQRFGDYTVHFSTFNSAFITPEVAQAYGITRARNQTLVNISVTHSDANHTSLGLPAKVSGTASNLLQQQRVLDFTEINEGSATYYLAPLKHTSEEVYNFAITVAPNSSQHRSAQAMTVNFSRKLYLKETD
jgi:hypothetical protein